MLYIKITFLVIISAVCLLAPGYSLQAASETESGLLPEIYKFEVIPSSISSGYTASLIWNVQNATSVSIDHDIGGVSAQGTMQVKPPYSTTYKITAMNGAGVRSRYITLFVTYKDNSDSSDNIDCDPVTGRNSSVDMSWEQLCLSSQYQVQIARDPGFTLKVYDSGIMQPADVTSPAFWYPTGNLEAGHTYYWRVRVRQAATGQYISSPWSEPKSFTVKPGYAVRSDYFGLQALTPVNGCTGCPVGPASFSWSGYPDTTRYRFVLARDSQLQNIIVEAFTPTSSYALESTLEYDASYFWQVSAIEPVPSDESAVFTFHTIPAPQPTASETNEFSHAIPEWAYVVMAAGILLIILAVIMIVQFRRPI